MLYFTSVKSQLEHASVVCNYISTTDDNKLERILQKFEALCYNRFLPRVYYENANALERLCKSRYHFDALFLIQIYFGFEF
jgi:hypothetical protein